MVKRGLLMAGGLAALLSLGMAERDGCASRNRASSNRFANFSRTMTVDGRERKYILHVPPQAARATAGLPLIIVLHGTYGSGRKMQLGLGFDAYADARGFFVAYPDAYEGMRWNDGRGTLASSTAGIDDVAFLVALIVEIGADYPVDLRQVHVTGASNGGMMTYRLGCEVPGVFAAIAPVIANVPEPIVDSCAPAPGLSVLAINGADDPVIPLDGGEVCRDIRRGCEGGYVASIDQSLERFAAANGCLGTYTSVMLPRVVEDGTEVEQRTYAGCGEGTEVQAYVIHGAGHTWPPRPPQLPSLGPATGNLDATAVIVEFFLRHSREGQP